MILDPAHPAPAGRPPAAHAPVPAAAWAVVTVLLAAAFVALLWVGSYAKARPTLGGIPFFYWYSMLWVLINAILQVIAYRLVVRRWAPRRTHAAGGSR
ncbi:MAG: DUF3311 domain-containing protein [Actinomycetes bacterium]